MLAAGDALIRLAETRCASTAEFLEKLKKLKYLLEVESEAYDAREWLGYHKLAEYGSIIATVATHFGIEEPA